MKTAHIYSGQGSQYKGMNKIFSRFTDYSNKYFAISKDILGYDIHKIISQDPNKKINNTKFTQPAIFIISSIANNIYNDRRRDWSCESCCLVSSI